MPPLNRMKTEPRERAVAFVVARLSSSRLPAKQLRTIGGKTILDWIMGSLATCKELDQVVLATVDEPANRPLRALARERGWACFCYPGPVDDVVGRLVAAASHHQAAICLLISADCPLVHGPSVDALVRQLRRAPAADYLAVRARRDGHVPLLEGVQFARFDAWQRAERLSERPELREHQFPVIHRHVELFQRADALLDDALCGPPHRLSVDTWADLEFMQTLYRQLSADDLPFALPAVVALLQARPGLRQINAHVHQRRLVEDVRRVLFVVDAGGRYGYGHLMRCRELAGQLVERLGWPAAFVVDDAHAAQLLEQCGFAVHWGALGRASGQPQPPRLAVGVDDVASGHDLVVVDLSVQRDLPAGWRERYFPGRPVVVIDREDAMAVEADLIVSPGVSGRPSARRDDRPALLAGLEHVILRREVRRCQALGLARDIDLLVYLSDPVRREQLSQLAAAQGWRMVMPETFGDEFPELLARSRVYLSGYGNSFYEAVALGAWPMAWPLTPAHALDASAFYRALDMQPQLISSADELVAAFARINDGEIPRPLPLEDGTPRIVARLAMLVTGGVNK